MRASVAAVLATGSTSLVDTKKVTGRYKDLLIAAVKTDCEEAGGVSPLVGYCALIAEVASSWSSSPSMQRFVLEILCRLRVIDPAVLVEYIVGAGGAAGSLPSRPDLWDIIDSCMRVEPQGASEEERGSLLASAVSSCIRGVYERTERNQDLQKKDPLYVSLLSGMKKIVSTAMEVSGAERYNVLRAIESTAASLNGGAPTVIGTLVSAGVSGY